MEIGILVAIFLLFIIILAALWWFNQRLKSLGNAIVPAVAVEIMKSIKSLLDKDK